jgi:hypothetical protein
MPFPLRLRKRIDRCLIRGRCGSVWEKIMGRMEAEYDKALADGDYDAVLAIEQAVWRACDAAEQVMRETGSHKADPFDVGG